MILPRYGSNSNGLSLNDFNSCCRALGIFPDLFSHSTIQSVFNDKCEAVCKYPKSMSDYAIKTPTKFWDAV
jgi:hypothetical protein